MKKLLFISFFATLLTACQSTKNDEIQVLKQEIENIKSVQRKIAMTVGLGELVRPDKITLAAEGIMIGSTSANIVMIEYTDLHCPFCKKFQQTVWPIFKKEFVDSNKVAVLARELPLTNLHPKAPYAAVMLRCADQQQQYEAVKDTLFEIGSDLTKADIKKIIVEHQLEEEAFESCLTNTDVHNIVTNSIKEASELGLSSTPTFIIGKKQGQTITDYKLISGSGDIEEFRAAVAELQTAN